MFEKMPLIALPITDTDIDNTLQKAKEKNIDIIELRIDQFKNKNLDHINSIVKKVKDYNFKALATVRSKLEGGSDIPDEDRLKIFNSIVKDVDIVDIEYTSEALKPTVVELVKNNNKILLMSYHDFEKTPSEDFIQNLIDNAKSQGADIVKYAFKSNSFEDVAKILYITHKNRYKNIVAIAMGDIGKISRVAGFVFGSLITYTYIGESFAPGQIEINKLKELLEFFKGGV